MCRGAGVGYRRLDSPAGGVLRRRRLEADLWPGVALWIGGLRVVAGSDRPDHEGCDGCGHFYWASLPGHDPRDSTSAECAGAGLSQGAQEERSEEAEGRVPAEYFADGLDPEVEQAVRTAIEGLRELGAEIREIKLPTTDAAVATYYVIATAEASSNLARYDGVKFGLRAKESKDLLDMYLKTRAGRIRAGGQAPDHAGHLCAERGLLRRLLREGAGGADVDPAGI